MKTNDVILKVVTKVTVFIIILYGLYIFFAGHYYPGGGFIGGLITAGAIVLLLLAYDIKTVASILPIDYKILMAIGLFIAVATSSGALFFNLPFLTHGYWEIYLPILGETGFHTAVFFDTGVYLVVVGVTLTIIQTIGVSE